MLCHWICSYIHTEDLSFEVEEDRSYTKSSFVSTMSSLATSSGVCSEGIDRILLISTKLIFSVSLSARACRREWSESRHSCGETTRASSDAHAQLLSGWADACNRSDIGIVSDSGKLYLKRHGILFREDKALKGAVPCYSFPHYAVHAGLHEPIRAAHIKHIC